MFSPMTDLRFATMAPGQLLIARVSEKAIAEEYRTAMVLNVSRIWWAFLTEGAIDRGRKR